MEDVLERGLYESSPGCVKISWFVDELMKLENKTAFCFENSNKDIIMTR